MGAEGVVARERRPQGSATADFLKAQAPVLSIAAFFLLMVLVFSLATGSFTSSTNLLNLLRQSAPLLIVAVAMTCSSALRTPAAISGNASGSSTRRTICPPVRPMPPIVAQNNLSVFPCGVSVRTLPLAMSRSSERTWLPKLPSV